MKLLVFRLHLSVEELHNLLVGQKGVVGGLVLVILSPQLEHDIALGTLPANILVLYSKMYSFLVSHHVSFLPKGFLT